MIQVRMLDDVESGTALAGQGGCLEKNIRQNFQARHWRRITFIVKIDFEGRWPEGQRQGWAQYLNEEEFILFSWTCCKAAGHKDSSCNSSVLASFGINSFGFNLLHLFIVICACMCL